MQSFEKVMADGEGVGFIRFKVFTISNLKDFNHIKTGEKQAYFFGLTIKIF